MEVSLTTFGKEVLKHLTVFFQVQEGPSGGAVAAAVISSIVVVVLLMGAAFYIVMRTRFVPRLRARMTNTPYECANLSQPPQMQNATSLP